MLMKGLPGDANGSRAGPSIDLVSIVSKLAGPRKGRGVRCVAPI